MTMIYRRKPKATVFWPILVIGGVVIGVVSLVQVFAPTFFANIFGFIGLPIMSGSSYVGSVWSSSIATIKSKQGLALENAKLKQDIADMQVLIDQAKVAEIENTQLKTLLGRASDAQPVLAAVLATPPRTPYDTLIIDIGADHAVAVGDRVIARGSVPIGLITEVNAQFSKVKLYSSGGESLDVIIGEKNVRATAIALGLGNFEMKLPKEAEVVEGDPITVPSIHTEVFGTVLKIETSENDPFKYVFFRLPVNSSELRWVQVEKVSSNHR